MSIEAKSTFLNSEEQENGLINNAIIIIPITTVPQFMYSRSCLRW